MNEKLKKELEEKINKKNNEYIEQLRLAELDFRQYCEPGGVNNWQHPEKPPTQASLALACKILKPKRILDLGTGLTGFTFRKYAPESESFLVESDPIWLYKLKRWLQAHELPSDNLWYYDDFCFSNLERYFTSEIQEFIDNNVRKFHEMALNTNTGETELITGWALQPPTKFNAYIDTTKLSHPNSGKMDRVTTTNYTGYHIVNPENKVNEFKITKDKTPEFPWTIGKFDFIHYDFGGMYVRTAYLRLAIDLLDRSKDSLIYIDDLHKKEILLEGKKFIDLVKETVEATNGIWLDCDEAFEDFQGGKGSLIYYPPLEDEA